MYGVEDFHPSLQQEGFSMFFYLSVIILYFIFLIIIIAISIIFFKIFVMILLFLVSLLFLSQRFISNFPILEDRNFELLVAVFCSLYFIYFMKVILPYFFDKFINFIIE